MSNQFDQVFVKSEPDDFLFQESAEPLDSSNKFITFNANHDKHESSTLIHSEIDIKSDPHDDFTSGDLDLSTYCEVEMDYSNNQKVEAASHFLDVRNEFKGLGTQNVVKRSVAKEETEVLIEKVREYSYLYDTSNDLYKDVYKKAETWTKIAEELNISSDAARMRWKNLRDSYLKYKKATNGATGQEKKYIKWPWSSHMQFLDDTFHFRPRSWPTSRSIEDGDEAILNEDEPMKKYCTEQIIDSIEENTLALQEMATPLSPNSQSHKSSQCTYVDKVIRNLETRGDTDAERPDGIDYLFLSYAQTFKKFSPLTQAKLKIEIATLFGRTEIAELAAQMPVSHSVADHTSSRS